VAVVTSRTTANFTTLLSAIGPARFKTLFEQHFSEMPLLALVKDKGKFVTETASGDEIQAPLAIGSNSTVQWSGGKAQITFTEQEALTQAKFPWSYVQGAIPIWDVDEGQNQGEGKLVDLLDALIEQAVNTMKDLINVGIGSTGSATPNAILGLKDAVGCAAAGATGAATTGYGPTSYGGVSVVDFADWQAKVVNSNGLDCLVSDLALLVNLITQGGSKQPDMIITDQTGYELYADKVRGKLEVSLAAFGDSSFPAYRFQTIPVMFDPNVTLGAQTDVASAVEGAADTAGTHRFYAVTGNSWRFVQHSKYNVDNPLVEGVHRPEDYLRSTRHMLVACQLFTLQRNRQGLLRNVPTA
jgi:hypothetical protein